MCRGKLYGIGQVGDFLDITLKAQATKYMSGMKFKQNLCVAKKMVNIVKKQTVEWDKIFVI